MVVLMLLTYNILYWGEIVAIQININGDKLSNFSTGAQEELKTQIEKYADEIIKEANLIEEGLHEDDASTEIISSYIIQAVRKSKTIRPKKKYKHIIATKVTCFVSSLITGALFDIDAIQTSVLRLILFLIAFAIAGTTTLIQIFEEERE